MIKFGTLLSGLALAVAVMLSLGMYTSTASAHEGEGVCASVQITVEVDDEVVGQDTVENERAVTRLHNLIHRLDGAEASQSLITIIAGGRTVEITIACQAAE